MTERCLACRSADTMPVLYGLPDYEAALAAERGELVLGGCVVGPGPIYPWMCRTCDYRFTTAGLDEDLDRDGLAAALPSSWDDLQVRRPGRGSNHLDPLGRTLVRSYDTAVSAPHPTFLDDDWVISVDRIKHAGGVRIGDTVLYLGETQGFDEITVWDPARILWLGAIDPTRQRWAVSLMAHYTPAPLTELTSEAQACLRTAADSLRPISSDQAEVVLAEVTRAAGGPPADTLISGLSVLWRQSAPPHRRDFQTAPMSAPTSTPG